MKSRLNRMDRMPAFLSNKVNGSVFTEIPNGVQWSGEPMQPSNVRYLDNETGEYMPQGARAGFGKTLTVK